MDGYGMVSLVTSPQEHIWILSENAENATLWWTNILPWKITEFFMGFYPLFLWPFSIAMLVHQMVYPIKTH